MATKQPTRGSNLDAARKGTTVHRVIREQLSAYFAPRYGPRVSVQIPGGSFEPYRDKSGLKIGGGPRQGQGDFDLAFRSMAGSVMLVAEVKPDNLEGRLGGQQLEHYINQDRKSTRLNSCHSQISYAVFCLKIKRERKYRSKFPSSFGFTQDGTGGRNHHSCHRILLRRNGCCCMQKWQNIIQFYC